jgi:hypothetical protein
MIYNPSLTDATLFSILFFFIGHGLFNICILNGDICNSTIRLKMEVCSAVYYFITYNKLLFVILTRF